MVMATDCQKSFALAERKKGKKNISHFNTGKRRVEKRKKNFFFSLSLLL